MAITAKVLQLGVPVVTAFQVWPVGGRAADFVGPMYGRLYGAKKRAAA